jgi:hypothetical protein
VEVNQVFHQHDPIPEEDLVVRGVVFTGPVIARIIRLRRVHSEQSTAPVNQPLTGID